MSIAPSLIEMPTLYVTKTSVLDETGFIDKYDISTDGPICLIHKEGIIYDNFIGRMDDLDEVRGFLEYMTQNTNADVIFRHNGIPKLELNDSPYSKLDRLIIKNRLKHL